MLRWFATAQLVKQRYISLPWNELLVSTCEEAAAKAAKDPPGGKPTFVDRRNTHSAARAQKGSAAMKEILDDFATAAKRAEKRIMVVVDLIGSVGDMADACYTRHRDAWIATKAEPNPSTYVRPPAETQCARCARLFYCTALAALRGPTNLSALPRCYTARCPLCSRSESATCVTCQRGRSSAWRPGKRTGPLPGHVSGRGPTKTSTQRSSPFQADVCVALLVVAGASVLPSCDSNGATPVCDAMVPTWQGTARWRPWRWAPPGQRTSWTVR